MNRFDKPLAHPVHRLIQACMLILIIPVFGVVSGCGSDAAANNSELKTWTVKSENIKKSLFFTGTIQPLHESTITNPMDAVVEVMPFHYGQQVKKNEPVFILNSAELQKQYNEILTEYLKAKDAFTVARAKFSGTEDLWQAGLMSKNNYLSEKSGLNNARVALMQSTRKLTEMIEKTGDDDNQLSSLNLAEFEKVRLALSKKHDQIFLKASGDGVLLYPPKTTDDKTSRITVGVSVKSGQVLALIGDMNGIRVEIDVPEVDIDKIKPGMKARIKSIAFPNDPLSGELVVINAQASAGNTGSLPSFSAVVEVRQLTAKQKEWVKVGMSATIELTAESPDKLMIPIKAVQLKNGQSLVKLQDKAGKIREVAVTTGSAEADKVIVESGLKAGDVVLCV